MLGIVGGNASVELNGDRRDDDIHVVDHVVPVEAGCIVVYISENSRIAVIIEEYL